MASETLLPEFSFNVIAQDGTARRGQLQTAWGIADTPAFMPVGTAASVKAMMPKSVAQTGAQIILANTYHLMLRPGADRIDRLGGVRNFMGWDGPLLTDSGGFQVMSLQGLRHIYEEGAEFKSHLDGKSYKLTPETSTEIQHKLDATITMAFDECTPFPCSYDEAAHSMERSMRWAARSREAFIERKGYGQFGIVQGSIFPDLREQSTQMLKEIGFEGYAIGGLAVGEGQKIMFEVLDSSVSVLPEAHPRYLMGVGKPDDIVGAVLRGVDIFDCVLPTRSGRTAQAFTRYGTLNMRNARHAEDMRPLDEDCSCPACNDFSRAYLHHLFKAGEIQAAMLLTWHNLTYYQDLMKQIRQAISNKTFTDFIAKFNEMRAMGDMPMPAG